MAVNRCHRTAYRTVDQTACPRRISSGRWARPSRFARLRTEIARESRSGHRPRVPAPEPRPSTHTHTLSDSLMLHSALMVRPQTYGICVSSVSGTNECVFYTDAYIFRCFMSRKKAQAQRDIRSPFRFGERHETAEFQSLIPTSNRSSAGKAS